MSGLPFFLDAGEGRRFCLYHAPRDEPACGGIVYVHPFAEEMNKCRRMAAMQASRFAELGFAVLQIDLFGCGDSDGEFGDASWEIWREDVDVAWSYLASRTEAPLFLWGTRAGCLLAADFAQRKPRRLGGLIFWQPVVVGQSYLAQFLRMRLAAEMLSGADPAGGSVRAMLEGFRAGKAVEVAGYEIAPLMGRVLESLRMDRMDVSDTNVAWLEVRSSSEPKLSAVSEQALVALRTRGNRVVTNVVPGVSFWDSQETTVCPALIAATADWASSHAHAVSLGESP